MTLYSTFMCWLIFDELFVLALLLRPLANKTASASTGQRLRSTVFNFNKRELLMLAAALSVTAFGIALYI